MSRSILDPRLCFECTYYDELADITREYQLLFFYNDLSVELTDLKTRKPSLKRITCNTLRRENFYLGSVIVVFGRVLTLTSYGDEVTRQLCERNGEPTVFVLGEALLPRLGSVLAMITEECGFTVKIMHSTVLSAQQTQKFALPAKFAGRSAVIVQAVRDAAVARGPDVVKRLAPDACVCAASAEHTEQLTQLAYEAAAQPSIVQGDTSVLLIKPHMVANNSAGDLLQQVISSGLSVTAISQLNLSSHRADEFLQPYKGVLADYTATVQHLAGKSWAVQVAAGSKGVTNAVQHLRAVAGPFDPSIAKVLCPKSLRARYGLDRVDNALHVTDLESDADLNAEFLFVHCLPRSPA
jgi:nucleoside-diphosphate kinase